MFPSNEANYQVYNHRNYFRHSPSYELQHKKDKTSSEKPEHWDDST